MLPTGMPFLWKFPFSRIYIFVWNIFIYVCMCSYTHVYICICIYLYMYKNKFFDSSVNTECSLLSVNSHGKGIDGGAGLVVTPSLTCVIIPCHYSFLLNAGACLLTGIQLTVSKFHPTHVSSLYMVRSE